MTFIIEKIESAKNFFLGLSTKLKIIFTTSILLIITGSSITLAVLSNNDSSDSTNTVGISGINERGGVRSNSTLSKEADEAKGDNEQNASSNQLSEQNTTEQSIPSSTRNTGLSSNGISNPKNQPTVAKPDYNLNDTWYFGAVYGAGLLNKCWPEVFTEENESRCAGEEIEFNEIGVAKTEQAANDAAENRLAQKVAAAHVELKKGAGPGGERLTEASCSQYGLSCGRW